MQRRHSLRHLAWRSGVAAVSHALMFSGIYPLVPHAVRRLGGGRATVRSTLAEWGMAALISAARPLGFLPLPGGHGPRPIIVLHGYAMNRANFAVLAYRLRKAGLVLNPATPLVWLDHVLDKLDLVLIMSVNPGFGGQSFIPEALKKLRAVKERIAGRDIWLEVDGGVKIDNIAPALPQAGINRADVVVEELVEGGLTRLMAIFQCQSAPNIGPIRSARISDADILALLQGVGWASRAS